MRKEIVYICPICDEMYDKEAAAEECLENCKWDVCIDSIPVWRCPTCKEVHFEKSHAIECCNNQTEEKDNG